MFLASKLKNKGTIIRLYSKLSYKNTLQYINSNRQCTESLVRIKERSNNIAFCSTSKNQFFLKKPLKLLENFVGKSEGNKFAIEVTKEKTDPCVPIKTGFQTTKVRIKGQKLTKGTRHFA